MKYGVISVGSVLLPKLTGSYENELHPAFEGLNWPQYDLCVDAGAAEGYYAVGWCWRFPHLRMIAYERQWMGRRRMKTLALDNGVAQRLTIRGSCTPARLQADIEAARRPLLIMDVEGYEAVLLDPARVPALEHTDFVVEVHPEQYAGLEALLRERFADTHTLLTIPAKPNKRLPAHIRLPEDLIDKAAFIANEFRGAQCWLVGRC